MITPSGVRRHFDCFWAKPSSQALNQEMADRLLQRLQLINVKPEHVLDLGCGDGSLCLSLKQKYKNAQIIGIDLSEHTLQARRPKRQLLRRPAYEPVCADVYRLPIASESCQLVTANLLVPFCPDLPKLFAEVQRILTVEGVFVFNSLGPDSFDPIKQFWPTSDQGIFKQCLVDMHDLGDELVKAQMTDPVIDVQNITIQYSRLLTALKEMYWWGVVPGLLGDGQQTSLMTVYRELRSSFLNGVDINLELINGHAWKPEQTIDQRTGEVNVSIEGLRSKL